MSVPITPGSGANIAADLISNDNHQLVKLEFGDAGAATQVSATNPLPVVTQFPATQAVVVSSLPLPAGAATSAKQDAQTAAVALVGTRAYGDGATRLTLTTSSQASTAIAATEVLLHALGSNTGRVYVRANATADLNDLPLEPGEKFHMRITSGNTINAILDTGAGFLNIVPVV